MSDSYLELAKMAIRYSKRPLHPKEILSIAKEQGQIPEHLNGKTQFKTLAARLSTDVRKHGKSSIFFRTAANRFYLREFESSGHTEYLAPKRAKTLHNERVLTVPDSLLRDTLSIGIFDNVASLLSSLQNTGETKYLVRKDAEKRYDVKQFISYALIYRSGKVLSYRRGVFSNAADELQGKRSIGFGGHVTEEDMNLFDIAGLGIIENARREISEELVIDASELTNFNADSKFTFLCGINTYDSDEAQKHLGISIVYFCTADFSPSKNEMSVNDLKWSTISEVENNIDDFEPWSKAILEAIYSGKLKIVPH